MVPVPRPLDMPTVYLTPPRVDPGHRSKEVHPTVQITGDVQADEVEEINNGELIFLTSTLTAYLTHTQP